MSKICHKYTCTWQTGVTDCYLLLNCKKKHDWWRKKEKKLKLINICGIYYSKIEYTCTYVPVLLLGIILNIKILWLLKLKTKQHKTKSNKKQQQQQTLSVPISVYVM